MPTTQIHWSSGGIHGGWVAPSRKMLPENGTGGVMVSKDGIDICAGFVYFTNSTMAWVEYIVSNKEYRISDRGDAIELLITTLSVIARDKGYEFVYASVKNKPLIQKYERCGFKLGDQDCQELIKIWQQ